MLKTLNEQLLLYQKFWIGIVFVYHFDGHGEATMIGVVCLLDVYITEFSLSWSEWYFLVPFFHIPFLISRSMHLISHSSKLFIGQITWLGTFYLFPICILSFPAASYFLLISQTTTRCLKIARLYEFWAEREGLT